MTTTDPTTAEELVAFLASTTVVRHAVAAAEHTEPTTPDEAYAWVLAWLAGMPPTLRGLVAGVLVDNRYKPELAAVRHQAMAERQAAGLTYAQIGLEFHTGASAVSQALTAHRKRQAQEAADGDGQ